MRSPRAEPRHALLLAAVAVIATTVLLATGGKGAGQAPAPATSAAGWRGLVGSRPRVALGERVIVVLKTPSLAQRVAAAGVRPRPLAVRFDDPAFGIQWPLAVSSMSDQDRNWPLTEPPGQVLPKSSAVAQ